MSSILGKIASLGIGEILSGVGGLAKDIRAAITGEISPEKKAEIEAKLLEFEVMSTTADVKIKELQASVIIAEAQGGSWLQRNWRPLLMLTIVAIVANNYLFFPYASLFTTKVVILTLPDALWNLMSIGVGGYIVGRSGEQIVAKWKGDATK